MHAPQIIILVLMGLGVTRGLYKHGEPDTDINFFRSLAGAALTGALLWWGGFFG